MKRKGDRHPLGRNCNDLLPLALLMLPFVMIKHRRELRSIWRETGE